jgi:hypothetical protein
LRIGAGGVSFLGGNSLPAAEATVASGVADALGGTGDVSDLGHVIPCAQPGPRQSRPDIVTAFACAKLTTHTSAVNATSVTAIARA